MEFICANCGHRMIYHHLGIGTCYPDYKSMNDMGYDCEVSCQKYIPRVNVSIELKG